MNTEITVMVTLPVKISTGSQRYIGVRSEAEYWYFFATLSGQTIAESWGTPYRTEEAAIRAAKKAVREFAAKARECKK